MSRNEKHMYEAIDNRANLPREEEDDTPLIFEPYHDDPNDTRPLPPSPDENGDPEESKEGDSFVKRNFNIIKIYILAAIFTICPLIIFGVLIQTGAFDVGDGTKGVGKDPLTDWHVDFTKAYPYFAYVDREQHDRCRKVWDKLMDVPCHSGLWDTSFDEGTFTFGTELKKVARGVCGSDMGRCKEFLGEAERELRLGNCGTGLAFHVDEFEGQFDIKKLMGGPNYIVHILLERLERLCHRDTKGVLCMPQLQDQWGFIDGIKTDGQEGLERFIRDTNSGFINQSGKRRYSKNSIDCSECLLDFMERNLMESKPWQSEEYLREWWRAGRRCKGTRFGETYQKVVDEYKQRASWPFNDNWDDKHTISDLVKYGLPGKKDFPIDAIDATIEKLIPSAGDKSTNASTPEEKLSREYLNCLEIFKDVVQDMPIYPFAEFTVLSEQIHTSQATAKAACDPDKIHALGTLLTRTSFDCPATRYGTWDGYDKVFPELAEVFSFNTIFKSVYSKKRGMIDNYAAACRAESRDGPICGVVFAQWGRADWVLQNPLRPTVEYLKDLIRTVRREVNALPSLPAHPIEVLDNGIGKEGKMVGKFSKEADTLNEEYSQWRTKIEDGVCNECVWRQFASPKQMLTETLVPEIPGLDRDSDVYIEWIRTVHVLREKCADRGRGFDEEEMKRVDGIWVRYYGKERWEKAFPKEERPGWMEE